MLLNQLRDVLAGHLCVVGVGNRLRGDDGAGPLLIDKIYGRVKASCFDVGAEPENYLEKVAQTGADHVLMIDAADFGGQPGEARLFEPESLTGGSFSTHALSLQMACDYLKARSPKTKVFLLAIQPVSADFGAKPSEPVAQTVQALAETFMELIPNA